jgi:hypothetical protein
MSVNVVIGASSLSQYTSDFCARISLSVLLAKPIECRMRLGGTTAWRWLVLLRRGKPWLNATTGSAIARMKLGQIGLALLLPSKTGRRRVLWYSTQRDRQFGEIRYHQIWLMRRLAEWPLYAAAASVSAPSGSMVEPWLSS